jgi:hypothetical protein
VCVLLGVGIQVQKIAEMRKKRTFKKVTFRGIDLDKLLDLPKDELYKLVRRPSITTPSAELYIREPM